MDYPTHWEADAVLSDGGIVRLRPIRPSDADALQAMHARLSPDTVYLRFFTMVRTLSERELERLTTVDHVNRVAFVALLRDEIIGVVRFDRLGRTTDAEVAVVVEDQHQGRGLGPLLLEHLAAAGADRGIERFVASVLPANRRMLHVFRSAGYEIEREYADGVVELGYPIKPTESSISIARAREHRAEARSVARLLAPRSVAVIGASRTPGAAGHEVLRALLEHGYRGTAYPVNPHATEVLGVPTFADVRDITDDLDLAVIAVPAASVLDVVRACADKHVRGLVVVTAGVDAAEVASVARAGGMRLIGPNAMGVVNTDPEVSLHATFATGSALPGRVGFFVQSGALAGTVLQTASARGLGMSSFVSIGDRADVSGNDLMQYWLEDDRTDVVALHLQGFGNPRKFARIARALGQVKPVVALKSGRGARDVAVDAMFRSAGVLRVDTLSQLFETAQLLAVQPLPAGPRVGIVGTSSALAALAVDACAAAGLTVTVEVDIGPLAAPDELAASLTSVASSGDVDALLVLVTPNASSNGAAILAAVGHVPLLASYLGHDGIHPDLDGPVPVPSFASPEDAAAALGRAVSYAAWRARPTGIVPALSVEAPDVSDLPHDGSWLPDARAVLSPYGLSPWPTGLAESASAARDLGDRLGWPVALKSPDDAWRHRIDVGAVLLSVGRAQLDAAWEELQQLVGPSDLLVQPMAAAGVSTVVRLVQDPSVGPLISLRLGGVAADLLADPVVRTLPLTDLDAAELVRSIRGVALLDGYDVAALEDVLHRVARIGEDLPSVAEVLLDPVLVHRSGVTLLHAGVRLLPPVDNPEVHARHLVRAGGIHLR